MKRQKLIGFDKGKIGIFIEINLVNIKCRKDGSRMELKLIGDKRTLLVNIDGELDHHISDELRAAIDAKILSTNVRNVIFDFTKVTFMDSSGIGVIMGRYKVTRNFGGKVIIFGVREQTKRIIEMCGINRLVKLAKNLEEALELI